MSRTRHARKQFGDQVAWRYTSSGLAEFSRASREAQDAADLYGVAFEIKANDQTKKYIVCTAGPDSHNVVRPARKITP